MFRAHVTCNQVLLTDILEPLGLDIEGWKEGEVFGIVQQRTQDFLWHYVGERFLYLKVPQSLCLCSHCVPKYDLWLQLSVPLCYFYHVDLFWKGCNCIKSSLYRRVTPMSSSRTPETQWYLITILERVFCTLLHKHPSLAKLWVVLLRLRLFGRLVINLIGCTTSRRVWSSRHYFRRSSHSTTCLQTKSNLKGSF